MGPSELDTYPGLSKCMAEKCPPPTFSKLSMAVVEARGKKKGDGLTPLDRDVRYPYAKLI